MVLRGRILSLVNSFPLFPVEARFAVVSRNFLCRSLTSDVSAVESYPLSGNPSSQQPGICEDIGRKHDIDVIIDKVLTAQSESEVFQSLVHDIECNKIQITHSLVTRLLHRFQDDWKSAIGVFRWVETCPGYRPLPEQYEKLVDILGKMKQMEKMKALAGEICENHLVSLNTIAKMMRRLAGAGEWKEAVKIFDELEKFGLEKNTESMNILLDTLCKEHKVEQARALFLELKSHIAPNANTYNIFIHGWCKIKRVEEAQWTIEEMKGCGFRPCVISYSTIIQFFCSRNKFHKVYELLDEMEAQGCPPNVVTFTTIMHSFTKSGYIDEALQIAEKMKLAGCKPDTQFCNALIHTLGRAGHIEEALNVFTKEMPNDRINPNTSTFNSMIAMFCHQKQEQRALEYLGILEQSPYCKPDVQSFYPLLKLYFRDGKTCKCLNLLDDMVKKHHLCLDLATYTLLIHGFCRGNKYERAYQLFKEMIGQNIKPRYVTCSLLLKEIKEKNMYGAAEMIEDFMKKMKSPGMKNCSNPTSNEV
ncbi:pentatricopeptide repeat-containing protein At3g04130, mitochondrial isoform X2 [Salvia miltiorrhiza]|uniref:pentatricopeptide repeat-containing protein At3g04130, mitochondrial isoform X2 n=1 Tax=Salvia miltiorrhiza TaxID=226208 RepID=UPI0025AD8356|nr:pentatricopeptide repeat-containing protein At3g04130, mitochondrial isoform X2 [Salvia miltiorrhiza]XP_057776903.1 pentatricopeptide repeat-containing protein At3g04130, mitochondrial isoform X2 [Salvia miltiorrhiza]XP_057776904.1 pentatricopeptide repeat-containing protein At3g04130, mitochondrial isoform X2 [Salvia miltiorrhiza]